MSAPSSLYHRHRFPPEISSYAVYLYYRVTVSYRDVEEMLARRGIAVSYETIRRWCLKFDTVGELSLPGFSRSRGCWASLREVAATSRKGRDFDFANSITFVEMLPTGFADPRLGRGSPGPP